MKKKIFSLLLSLAIVVIMMPATALTAWAAESSVKTATSVASVDCDGTVTYYDNLTEAVTKANSSDEDCEIKILKDCACDGGIVLNNTSGKVITFNTGDEGTELTIKATADNQPLIEVKSSVNFKGNGGMYVADCNEYAGIFGVHVTVAVTVKMYDGFVMKIVNGKASTRGFALNSASTGYLYGGKILCPKANEAGANMNLSTVVAMTNSNLYIYGGEYHWDVAGGGDYYWWAGVTDCSNSSIYIYDGYFDGPLWGDGSQDYQLYGGKYTTNKLKNSWEQKDGNVSWDSYVGVGKTASEISEIYNGTTYTYGISTENGAVINVNTNTIYVDLASGINAVLNGQTLRMLNDLQEEVTVLTDKSFSIDLNGYVLKGNGSNSVVTVQQNGNLTIKDSNPDKKHNGYIASNGLWHLGTGSGTAKTISGGIITGGNNSHGAGILILGGTLTMNGGIVAGNLSTDSGGGVCVGQSNNTSYTGNSSFTIKNGTILGNVSSTWGGGVCVGAGENSSSQFVMEGGTITDNTAQDGGGVHVGGSGSSNSFTMKSGVISNNRIYSTGDSMGGAGVSVFFYNNGTSYSLVMSGGSITGNTALGNCTGGGVFVHSGNYGTITLGGTVKITGNKLNDNTSSNFYLPTDKTIKLGIGSEAPTSGMKVGVTTQTLPQTDSPVAITSNGTNADAAYFRSDNTHYSIKYNIDHLELVVSPQPTPEPTPEPEPEVKTQVEMLQAKTSGSRAVNLSWNGIDNASKYVLYGAKCGNNYRKLKTTTSKSYTVKKIAGKKLKAHKAYKFYVIAYDTQGNKVKSKSIHFITGNTQGKYANVKSIKAKYDELLLSVGVT